MEKMKFYLRQIKKKRKKEFNKNNIYLNRNCP